MKLVRVEYEFFDFEDPSPAATTLARQVRLVCSDAPRAFVSWTSERQHGPDSEPYTIGRRETSFFQDEPGHVVDASEAPAWSMHIGREVELSHVPASSPAFTDQVLEMRSVAGRTYVYSLGLDRVGISNASPITADVGEAES